MLDRVRNLAQFIRVKKGTGEKFVLMLGAGASLGSGVKPTAAMIGEIVQAYARGSTGSIEDRFDQLWQQSSPDHRELMLKPYLDRSPSRGYERLADLIQLGYFDVVVTFNFDRLLERALDDSGFREYRTIIRGETATEALSRLVQSKEPRVRILKMHGSLRSSDYFLFSKEEMLNYPPDLRTIMSDLTAGDILICGYAFNDVCVIRSFNDSRESGGIWYINPSGAGENIKGFLIARRSQERVITGDLGKFDDFFEALHAELTRPVAPASPRLRQNLFKFLDHYHEDQKSWFLGRRKVTRKLQKRFDGVPPPALLLYGGPHVGKTSLIRAGLMPRLDPTRFECIYLRCRRDIEPHLALELGVRYPALAQQSCDAALAGLAGVTPKHVVLILDQFERVARAADDSPPNRQKVLDAMSRIFGHAKERLSIVCVAVDEKPFWKLSTLLSQLPGPRHEMEEIEPLSAVRVASIIRHSARRGGVPLAKRVIEELCEGYRQTLEQPSSKSAITLTHVQTLCYYLVRGYDQWEGFERMPNQGLNVALESLREESSLINLLDDLPLEERRLIRSFLKVICDPGSNTRKIVEFIKDHFPDIKDDRFPEPLV